MRITVRIEVHALTSISLVLMGAGGAYTAKQKNALNAFSKYVLSRIRI